MIALGGTIGTGLFVGSGQTLALGGPAFILVCYIIITILVYFIVTAITEVATYLPVHGGAMSYYGYRYVSRSMGFAMGYLYWYALGILVPYEGMLLAFFQRCYITKAPKSHRRGLNHRLPARRHQHRSLDYDHPRRDNRAGFHAYPLSRRNGILVCRNKSYSPRWTVGALFHPLLGRRATAAWYTRLPLLERRWSDEHLSCRWGYRLVRRILRNNGALRLFHSRSH